jgi:ribonucleotide reductase alpha subunit
LTKPWSNLATVVYKRTYARKDNGRTENWAETCERVIGGNVRGHNVSDEEIRRLRFFMNERKATPAGRGTWYSGSPGHARLGGVALNNCWFLTADEWENYVLAQDLLMLGGGVGMSVEHEFSSRLPKIRKDVTIVHRPTKDAEFIVPDSREGWNELTRRVLEAFFVTGRSFSYSTICVRGAGEAIKGFGGTASGPGPLVTFVEKLCAVLSSREGRRLRPIDAADVLCSIAEMVVSGNVRRSALIVIGDAWDKDFLRAKRWDLGTLPTQRACANFSVIAEDVDDLHPLFWATYEHGEPFGIVNRANIRKYGRMGELRKDTAVGCNPCQPKWAQLLTPYGIRQMGDISVGDQIWSGKRWTTVIRKWSTGIKPVYKWHTTAGVFAGTKNHRVVSDGEKVEVQDADSIDTAVGPAQALSDRIYASCVMDGLVFGDGMVHKASNDKVVLIVGEDDRDYFTSEVGDLLLSRCGVHPAHRIDETWEVETDITADELPKTYERVIPDRYVYTDPWNARAFLRGLYSANGSLVANRVTLKASSFAAISQVQQMLSSLGIRSYYTTNSAHDTEFSNGTYTCRESYDLNIGTAIGRELFAQLIGFLQPYKNEKLAALIHDSRLSTKGPKLTFDVTKVEYVGDEEVWDITVDDEEHVYWTGGCLVSNCAEATLESREPCNLQEIPLPNLSGVDEFVEAARLMHRYGKRVTMERYHHPEIQEVVERNRRVGTGITGCLQVPKLFNPQVLDRVYAAIQEENVAYSAELGINPSIRTTVIKPSGTKSKMLDVAGEGLHCALSRWMIQRVRIAASDPLIPELRARGHHMEPVIRFDGSLDLNTLVVDFYVEAPADLPCADEGFDTWRQLDVLLMAQKHWCDQAASVTVYYSKEEVPEIKAWLRLNLKNLKTISFLLQTGHGFVQAPKEPISKEQYDELSSKIEPLDLGEDLGGDDVDSQDCAGGACPVK